MTVRELRNQAKELQIRGYSKMTKDQLEQAIAQIQQKVQNSAETILVGVLGDITLAFSDGKINGTPVGHFLLSLPGEGSMTAHGRRRLVRKMLRHAGLGFYAGLDLRRLPSEAA